MPSPFPGIDPWLEQHWGDVHTRIITYLSDAIQEQLPGDLRASVEEHVRLEWEGPDGEFYTRTIVPDVMVVESPVGKAAQVAVAVEELDEPVLLEPVSEEQTERYVEIRDYSNEGRLVTVIEVISKPNKSPGSGLELHLQKRRQSYGARVHLVEIDLLRGGTRELPFRKYFVPQAYDSPGVVVVTRQQEFWPRFEVYPCGFARRLPTFRIPLRPGDQDAILRLQEVYNLAYDRGRYRSLNYNRPPEPLLTPEEQSQVDEFLKKSAV